LSLSRAEAKNLRALQTRKGRRLTGLFLAEGVRLLEEAVRFRIKPRRVFWAPSLLSERGVQLVERMSQLSTMVTQVSAAELARIVGTETSQGIAAVFDTPMTRSTELDLSSQRNVLLCENISDPGNLGTLIRSAAAFAFNTVVLVGQCTEPFSPKVVRASAGAIFGVTIIETSVDRIMAQSRQGGAMVIAASTEGAEQMKQALDRLSRSPLILAIGSEAKGLSESIIQAADRLVRIGHSDRVESLNAAIAGSILMKQCYDQRIQRKP